MQRLIFHVDVNSAFLSWEAAKRVKQGLPDLRENILYRRGSEETDWDRSGQVHTGEEVWHSDRRADGYGTSKVS